jgi:hypothetical protein
MGMIAVAGILGTVGIAIVSFAVPHPTTSTSKFLFLINLENYNNHYFMTHWRFF